MSVKYETGNIVWVRLGSKWWPGRVGSLEDCPLEYTSELKKEPLAIVKFFNESEFQEVTKDDQINPYNCSRKQDFLKKGLKAVQFDQKLKEKFESDIVMAEKLTGGNMNIIDEIRENNKMQQNNKRRIDYSDLGFGTPKIAKKQVKDHSVQQPGVTAIGEIIRYKTVKEKVTAKIEYKSKIMIQPATVESSCESPAISGTYKCYACNFTCGRLDVIVWHNKAHLKKVADYDSGISVSKKKKRKSKVKNSLEIGQNIPKLVSGKNKEEKKVNGINGLHEITGTQEILADWEEEDEDDFNTSSNSEETREGETQLDVNGDEKTARVNGDSTLSDAINDSDSDYGDYPSRPNKTRQPMPKQVDINFAFDALLAESAPQISQIGRRSTPQSSRSSTSHRGRTRSKVSYSYKDTDSEESSDWDKYMKANSSESDNERTNKRQQIPGAPLRKPVAEKKISPVIGSRRKRSVSSDFYPEEKYANNTDKKDEKCGSSIKSPSGSKSAGKRDKPGEKREKSLDKNDKHVGKREKSADKNDNPREEEEEKSQSSSNGSSTSSGPAYMLVAVDAQGNNVPMPVLSEGGNHLVAVEASMEDGTTRTLYIDPAHLGPNVDLNNLMLHIDNSGQETVIIPTSSVADTDPYSTALIDNNPDLQLTTKEFSSKKKPDSVSSCQADRMLRSGEDIYRPGDVVWVQTHGFWWPSVIRSVNEIENVSSVLFVNGEDAEIKVGLERLKIFKKKEYKEIYNSQVGKAVGLTEAMNAVYDYKNLFDQRIIDKTASEFFSLSLDDQKNIIEKNSPRSLESTSEFSKLLEEKFRPAAPLKNGVPETKKSLVEKNSSPKNESDLVGAHTISQSPLVDRSTRYQIDQSEKPKTGQSQTSKMDHLSASKEHCPTSKMDHSPTSKIDQSQASKTGNSPSKSDHSPTSKNDHSPTADQSATPSNTTQLCKSPLKTYSARIPRKETPNTGSLSSKTSTNFKKTLSNKKESPNTKGFDSLSKEQKRRKSSKSESETDKNSYPNLVKPRKAINERYVLYMQSVECLEYLKSIVAGRSKSARHKYFKENFRDRVFSRTINDVYNAGMNFFGADDTEQAEELIVFYVGKFENWQRELRLDSSSQKLYVMTVIFPEAIKQALRSLTKLPEERIEAALEIGIASHNS